MHTPGPWHVSTGTPALDQGDALRISAAGVPKIADVIARDVSYNQQAANARLIAAAPDLLAALRKAYELIEDLQPVVLGESETAHYDRAIHAAIRAAITKATGGQP